MHNKRLTILSAVFLATEISFIITYALTNDMNETIKDNRATTHRRMKFPDLNLIILKKILFNTIQVYNTVGYYKNCFT